MAEVQAVLTDIDNTFLYADSAGQDVIPQSHIQATRIVEELDMPVLPVTSRSLALMKGVQNTAGFSHSAVLDNGASVFHFGSGEYIARRWLPATVVQEVAAAIKPHSTLLSCEVAYNPVPADQLDPDQLQSESPSIFAHYEITNEGGLYRALGKIAGIKATEPMLTNNQGIRCVQITLPGVDKFSGVKIMLKYEGLEGKPVLVLADNRNDKPLYAAVPEGSIKVLMGDAPPDMDALANRPRVGTAKQEGWAYAVRRYAIEPRKYGIDDRELRPAMSQEDRDRILARLHNGEPLADATLINELVANFESPEPIDPWQAVNKLARALGDADSLLLGDLNILRPLRGIEHAGTVLSSGEEYIPLFQDAPPIVRVVKRFADMCGDIGKVLSVADTGQNFAQAEYNLKVTTNILKSTNLPEYAKRAVELLGRDVIGGLLQGREGAEAALAALRQEWPEELAEYFDDLVLNAYMDDASAHSDHRQTLYIRTGQLERAVRPDDAQLTFLFVRHPSGVLTLTPDRAELVARHLPNLRRLRHLIVSD